MATVNEKMTALADEIRELSGSTTVKSIDAMTSDVNSANTEIAEQTELLEQIATALEGKASGITLPTLDNPASASDILSGKEAIDGYGNKITGTMPEAGDSANIETCTVTINCNDGSYINECGYIAYENNSFTPKAYVNSSFNTNVTNIVLNNVVCGTLIFVMVGGLSLVGSSQLGGIELVSLGQYSANRYYKAPTIAGSHGTIDIIDND